jgi:general secretion pathway protein A
MYLEFYGLSEKPFTQTPDPRFLYWNDGYRETLASLRYGILERKGFIAMVGEAGTGKTTLLRKLLDDLGDEVVSVFLFNPNATFEEILEYTLSELGISSPAGKKLAMLQQLNEFLLAAFSEGRNTILLIDEAQDLDIEVLESLRLLSNLETAQDKILQIVLSGQPELADRLADPSIRQLKQRIAVRCRLDPLTREELPEFIEARLTIAGGAPSLFLPESLDAIWQYSSGIPRLINTVCDNALLVGYALGRKTIDREVLREVIADLEKIDPRHTAPILESSSKVIDNPEEKTSEPADSDPVDAPPTAPVVPARPAPEPSEASGASGTNATPPAPSSPANNSLLGGLLAVGLLLFAAVAWFRDGDPAATNQPTPITEALPAVEAPVEAPEPLPATDPGIAVEPEGAAPLVVAALPEEPPAAVIPLPAASPVATPNPTPNPTASPSPTESPRPTDAPRPAAQPVRQPASEGEPDPRIARTSEVPRPKQAPTFASVVPAAPTRPLPSARPAPQQNIPENTALSAAQPAGTASETDPNENLASAGASVPIRLPALVEIELGDTLAAMANRVYGRQSYTLLDLIQAANPGLDDPSRIIAGGVVLFPSLDAATRVVTGAEGQLQVIALTTPSLRQALAQQSLLQKETARPVEIETVSLYDGPDLYRVFLPGFESPDDALRMAQIIGPVLKK